MKLVFVYNANSGRLNAWLDSAHKILRPSTYACNLCDLTYGVFKEREEWVRFRENINRSYPDLSLEFLHIDELLATYPAIKKEDFAYPIILRKEDQAQNDLTTFVSTTVLQKCSSTQALIDEIHHQLELYYA